MKRFVLFTIVVLCIGLCSGYVIAQTGDDPDHDNLTTLEEQSIGTDPWLTDTDRDGIGDGTEIAKGTDPRDAGSKPSDISLKTYYRLWVTDVIPGAFSVVWVANREASCFVNVYADADGKEVMTNLTIIDESALHPPAEQKGVMKVRVSGLEPGTTYYFRRVTISNDLVLVEPAGGPLPSVTTELTSVVVENDFLRHRVWMIDGSTPAKGALVLANVEGGSYPITGWVGDGITAPDVLINLRNVYSAAEHRNLELLGGESITLESIGGLMGFQSLKGVVPARSGKIQTLLPEPSDKQCTLGMMPGPKGLRIERR
jgi:hypothetical protein